MLELLEYHFLMLMHGLQHPSHHRQLRKENAVHLVCRLQQQEGVAAACPRQHRTLLLLLLLRRRSAAEGSASIAAHC
jgi:hypothetical protein